MSEATNFHPVKTAGNASARRKQRRSQYRLFKWMEANPPPFEMVGGVVKAGTSQAEIEAYDQQLAKFFTTKAAAKIFGNTSLYRMLRREATDHLTKSKNVVV